MAIEGPVRELALSDLDHRQHRIRGDDLGDVGIGLQRLAAWWRTRA
mgnify:CR=1 FL=1